MCWRACVYSWLLSVLALALLRFRLWIDQCTVCNLDTKFVLEAVLIALSTRTQAKVQRGGTIRGGQERGRARAGSGAMPSVQS